MYFIELSYTNNALEGNKALVFHCTLWALLYLGGNRSYIERVGRATIDMKDINGDFLSWPETLAVFQALNASGAQVFFVGGCIRDNLLGVPVRDVDIATDLMPADVVSLAQENGLRTLSTGIQYGTVTVISGGKLFEVTTFRRDI